MNKTKQSLRFVQYGSDDGRIVIYFHGVPGSPEECEFFNSEANAHNLRFISFDRFSVHPSIKDEAYYRLLAQEISIIANGKQVDIVGFSIGAFVAMQTCLYLNNQVRSLHLISAAAPLDAGNYLDSMAGKQVFQLAKNSLILFTMLSYWQSLLALIYPKALFGLLFASAVAKDKDLSVDIEFQSSVIKSLKSCFIERVQGYIRDVRAYVTPWKNTISEIKVDITYIWHGSEDNWSPKVMADYLVSAIPGQVSVAVLNGCSHYACLQEVQPIICRAIGQVSTN